LAALCATAACSSEEQCHGELVGQYELLIEPFSPDCLAEYHDKLSTIFELGGMYDDVQVDVGFDSTRQMIEHDGCTTDISVQWRMYYTNVAVELESHGLTGDASVVRGTAAIKVTKYDGELNEEKADVLSQCEGVAPITLMQLP
jgi:hypothetical protein